MSISRKPRHWIALVMALATTIVAIISFADFSGEPAPRWRVISLMVGPTLTVLAIIYNLVLDGRGSGRSS